MCRFVHTVTLKKKKKTFELIVCLTMWYIISKKHHGNESIRENICTFNTKHFYHGKVPC